MAKRKMRHKPRTIQLKSRSRKARRRSSHSFGSIRSVNRALDHTVSVRSILKYSGITLAFVIVLISVFMLGRISLSSDDSDTLPAQTQELSGETKAVAKESEAENNSTTAAEDDDNPEETDSEEEEDDIPEVDVVNLSESEDNDTDIDDEFEEADYEEVIETVESECRPVVAGFDYNYNNVEVAVTDFKRFKRGDNWASLESLKLTITNNEKCTIINPNKIKIKLNSRGKGSVWWDDDVHLPDSFKRMLPGDSVSEVISVHVSYSDIYSEKDFKLTVFDDYDIAISTFKKYITFT
ncbi:hypothetical protein ACFL3V_05295 [Nanoarchaeota archaeon]